MVDLFSFEGRVRRSTFWVVTATVIAVYIFIKVVLSNNLIVVRSGSGHSMLARSSGDTPTLLIVLLTYILTTWVSLANHFKRWHDADMSGWWTLMFFIPFVNAVAFLICGFLPGTKGTNQYGSDPRVD
jgi:uncharacterized membrane protein YhaH (DUF805 family)